MCSGSYAGYLWLIRCNPPPRRCKIISRSATILSAKQNGGQIVARWEVMCLQIESWGFVSCQSQEQNSLISFKFTSWQEYFDEWIYLTYGTLDCCQVLPIQAVHNTASLIHLCFHITIENAQLDNLGVLDSIGSNIPTRWHVPWTRHVYTPSRNFTNCSSIPAFSVSDAPMDVNSNILL